MEPLISVVVPIFNAEEFLKKCLISLQQQSYSNIEVLMIDDGSKDQSSQICEEFAERDIRFRYFYQENAGVSSARNLGLDMAKGDFIGFCDSDDWVDPDMYAFLLRLIHEHDADVSICAFYLDSEYRTDTAYDSAVQIRYTSKESIIEMHKGEKYAGHLCNKLFRKTAVGDLRLDTDIHIMEDMLFVGRILQKSVGVVYQNAKKYHYIHYYGSNSNCYRESYWSIQSACDRMLEMIEGCYPEISYIAQKTVLLGNMMLANKISAAGRLDTVNYERIIDKINANHSVRAVSLLSNRDKRMLKVFRCSRNMYNLFVCIEKIKGLRSVRRLYAVITRQKK